jgi:hypothetical protein
VTGAALGGGLLVAGVAARAWRTLLAAVALAMVAWLVGGAPALERRTSARDSLRPFATAVAARVAADEPLAFFADPIRAVVVYSGRTIPTVRRRADLAPGTLLILRKAAYRRLARRGLLGPPLLAARGRTGNVARGPVVLARALDDAAPKPHL